MKHAVTRELYAYWTRLRRSRSAPERRDIDPAAIRGILNDTFIAEVDYDAADPAYPLRLAGTRLNALFLAELKGRPLRGLWRPEERGDLLGLLSAVVETCSPLVAGLRAGPEGHRPIDLEMILLPLRHQGRTHSRLLGAIAPNEVPSWLGLLPVRHFSVTSHRLIGPQGEHPPAEAAPVAVLPAPRRYGPFVLHQGGR